MTGEQYKDCYVVEYYNTDLPIVSQQDEELLCSWDFPFYKIQSPLEKIKYIFYMFKIHGFVKKLNIQEGIFQKFLLELQQKYDQQNNPFHNFQHAIAVSQAIYYFLNQKLFEQYLDFLDEFTLLFSALGHDVAHTGRTNTFEVAIQSKLAIKHNDESVLENHHASTLFKLLIQNNFLKNISVNEQKTIRKYCISNILSTDMKKHKEITQQFEIKLTYKKKEKVKLIESENDKKLMCGFIVHVADLTGPTKKFELAKQWSLRICEEFTLQVQDEQKLGIPVTSYLLGLDQLEIISKQESNFYKIIILPLYNIFIDFVGDKYQQMCQNCENNIIQWEKIHLQEKYKNSVDGKFLFIQYALPIGSPEYNPPEINENNIPEYSPLQIDVFQLGCVLFMMVMNSAPFENAISTDRYYSRFCLENKSYFWKIFYNNCKPNLINKMLEPDPLKRINIQQIVQHSWYN
ncbi:hypothetical protein IMG5_056380, partial [Ichthyophthirius multifiliis]